ncbi:MAG: hypothetical protein LBC53_05950 [Spirochaetaceae bacterium]|nr:hypothetical protein [Spirochaetaceae bacterium]
MRESTELFEKCSEPKETNRQIGPLFKRWLANGGLGIKPVGINVFQILEAVKTPNLLTLLAR